MSKFDTEEYRKAYWEREYSQVKEVPSSRGFNPSSSLRQYFESDEHISKGNALDLGSGNGRNSFFLSEKGFSEVVGIEFSEEAVNISNRKLKKLGYKGITFINKSLGEKIEYPNDHFNLIIDMMTMHALTKESRKNLFGEVKRVLAPGGHFLFFTMSTNSEAAKKLIKENAGEEEGSYRFDFNGTTVSEKTFTKEELEKELAPLEFVHFGSFEHVTKAFGGEFRREYISGIMGKLRE